MIKHFLWSVVFVVAASGCGRKQQMAQKDAQILQLQQQLDHFQSANTSLLDRLSDLSVVTKAGAESIQQSLENINRQYGFIEDLTRQIHHKDSINLALVTNIKRSLDNIHDEDVYVEVRGGVVHVSISDKLLFQSGSAALSKQARHVLGKIATVVNDHHDLDVLVEGHTDNVPIENACTADNWDLSVRRATAVVRALQTEHFISPDRLTAAGRGEHQPKASNEDATGRSLNRRTEIVISPRLDQFFKLLESPALAG